MAESMIHIDMTQALMDMPVRNLVRLANIALNQLDMRTMSDACFHAGVTLQLNFEDHEETDHG